MNEQQMLAVQVRQWQAEGRWVRRHQSAERIVGDDVVWPEALDQLGRPA
jgi:hypothetical protein